MIDRNNGKLVSAIFITFPGNCRRALTFYQTCFGGTLQFETFRETLEGYAEVPVISGSLVSDSIIIHGSDLVYDEGRTLGNYMSIFLHCQNTLERKALIEKLAVDKKDRAFEKDDDTKLIEVVDAFDVRWVLHI
ncbi:PhnB protein [Parapedobacter luteus]|uniref:PhnB protein n=1 Tax=Parapedobacter luteus TaxID=623280 RepID=A0A1T5DBY0_9SPHI|nr:glyoxalase [Parapedobacter luteus]SKB69189.1 PhnB protein [Parapedobacter luteus]